MMKRIAIIDIDGTLADLTHRLHHVKNGNREWPQFFEKIPHDKPITQIIQLVQSLYYARPYPYAIFLVSGRGNESRNATEAWLKEHNVPYHRLFMRPEKDYRKDFIIKREILAQIRNEFPDHTIDFVVDDRPSVVKMWRDEGLICLHCADWTEDATQVPYPYGQLTLMVGPSGAGKSTWLDNCYKPVDKNGWQYGIKKEHIISSDAIRAELSPTNDFRDQTKNAQVFQALHQLVKARITNGLDVVVDATNIKTADRKALAEPYAAHTKVRYIVIDRPLEQKYETAGWRHPSNFPNQFDLIAKHHNTFQSNLKDILKGDNLPNVEVIDLRKLTDTRG